MQLKWSGLDTHALLVGWDEEFNEKSAGIGFSIPEQLADLSGFDALVFSVSDAGESTLPEDWEKPEVEDPQDDLEEENPEEDKPRPVDWTIVVKDSAGIESRIPLSRYGVLYPQIREDTRRASIFYSVERSEPQFRYYAIPVSDFALAAPEFDSQHVAELRFDFDLSSKGVILVDDVGFVLK